MIDFDVALQRGSFEVQVKAHCAEMSTGILGASGSGKTSLLLALAGVLPAQRMRLTIRNEVVVDTEHGWVPPPHTRRVGIVFQDHRLFPHMSVATNLRYGMRKSAAGGLSYDDVLQLLDIGDLVKRRPHACSGGQRQRVAIGRALLANPRLLLLDEPLSSLDPHLKRTILPYIARIRKEADIPLLMVSHDVAEIVTLTDEILLLGRGKMLGQGTIPVLAKIPDAFEYLHQDGLWFPQQGTFVRNEDGASLMRLDGPASVQMRGPVLGNVEPSARVVAFLRPDDIAVGLPETGEMVTTLSNQIAATITHIQQAANHVLLTLDAGTGAPMLADITPHALGKLGLREGSAVVLLFKARSARIRLQA
jgi:molybdate transport system ATP-binding protein